jgi:23S rRNA pseudouridine1911/1915/1917 synthase
MNTDHSPSDTSYHEDDEETPCYTHTVTQEQAGKRLDKILGEIFTHISRSRIQGLIEEGAVTCPQTTRTLNASRKVQEGWVLTLDIPQPLPIDPLPQDIPLDIIYEDDHILVINKAAGMAVHPGAGMPDGTVVNAVLFHAKTSLSGIGGHIRPGIVHRIDKDTTGLLVVAKHDQAHVYLARQFERHTLERRYHAIVWGCPAKDSGRIETLIGRSRYDRKKMCVLETDGKKAITHWKVLKRFYNGQMPFASLIECQLETGRTHQIRVHLTHIGHSLIGDPVYGGAHTHSLKNLSPELVTTLKGFKRQALHAKTLGFYHPHPPQERMNFSTPLPHDLKNLLTLLEDIG